MKVSFVNPMGKFCERVGAVITEVSKGIGLDARIGPQFLNVGVGWGGSCPSVLGKGSAAQIGREYGYRTLLLEAAQQVNYSQRLVVISKLQLLR